MEGGAALRVHCPVGRPPIAASGQESLHWLLTCIHGIRERRREGRGREGRGRREGGREGGRREGGREGLREREEGKGGGFEIGSENIQLHMVSKYEPFVRSHHS